MKTIEQLINEVSEQLAIDEAVGCKLRDAQGNVFVDYLEQLGLSDKEISIIRFKV